MAGLGYHFDVPVDRLSRPLQLNGWRDLDSMSRSATSGLVARRGLNFYPVAATYASGGEMCRKIGPQADRAAIIGYHLARLIDAGDDASMGLPFAPYFSR
jgi:hypothetical protein